MKYGLLTYSTHNVGDDIQSIAARQFLPSVDFEIDRDDPAANWKGDECFMIANGWFSHRPQNFPPPLSIRAWWVSTHLVGSQMCTPQFLTYLRSCEPIGCRDIFTLHLLREHGISAYWSGCLTTTIRPPNVERSDEILIVDVPRRFMSRIPRAIQQRAVYLTHSLGLGASTTAKRFEIASDLLGKYAAASLVITGRLHCALPCSAFGTPCIFLPEPRSDPRYTGLLQRLYAPAPDSMNIDWRPPASDTSDIASFLCSAAQDALKLSGNPFTSDRLQQIPKSLRVE